MPGNYPNVPSWRMALDRDGTQWFWISASNVVTPMSASEVLTLCNESEDSLGSIHSGYFFVIFPELRDVDAFFLAITSQEFTGTIETSVNSTNGIDGTWVYQQLIAAGLVVQPLYRSNITASTYLAIKAIRFRTFAQYGAAIRALHLFGEIAPTQNPNRLALWHPTLNQRITPSYFDWGDVPRSSSADKQFRVKNLSASLSANSIRVAQDILTDTFPSVVGQHTLSTDALTFLAQVNVGILAPGAISGVVTLRRVTPANAILSVWAHRVFAEAASWS